MRQSGAAASTLLRREGNDNRGAPQQAAVPQAGVQLLQCPNVNPVGVGDLLQCLALFSDDDHARLAFREWRVALDGDGQALADQTIGPEHLNLPISSLPQVDFPVIQVTTQLPGASADTSSW